MTDTQLLQTIQLFIDTMNKTNKQIAKKEILSKTSNLKKLFKYTYDPDLKYNVTPSSIKKREKELKQKGLSFTGPKHTNLYNLLKYLTETTASHKSRDSILYYISKYPKHKKLIYILVDKGSKLSIRVGSATIIKVFPGLFNTFNVSLGKAFKHNTKQFNKSISDDTWYISRKYDGVRCILKCTGTVTTPIIKAYSRYGKLLDTLPIVIDYVEKFIIRALNLMEEEKKHVDDKPIAIDFVLDGEIIVEDEKGNENFAMAVGDIRRKNHVMEHPKYKVFDMLTNAAFDEEKSPLLFSHRIDKLKTLLDKVATLEPPIEIISLVKQHKYTKEKFEELCALYIKQDWEGLILRKDAPYKGKRSNDILKVKRGGDKELKVISITSSTKKILEKDVMVEKSILAAAIVENDYNDNKVEVNVGSGFSDQQRLDWYKNPDKIIGKTIRVSYMQEEPTGSLRHPIFKGIVGDQKREV